MFPPLHLYSFQIIAKLIIIFFQLFKINKNIQDTLSLCVSRNGTKKSGTTYRCTSLLSTNRTCSILAHPVFSQAFVNFSQFNLDFHEFRNLHNLNSSFAHRPSILNDSRKLCIYSDFQFISTRYWILMSFS